MLSARSSYSGDAVALERFLSVSVPIHLNPFAGGVGSLRVAGLFGFRCRRTVSYAGRPDLLLEELPAYMAAKYRILCLVGGAHMQTTLLLMWLRKLPAEWENNHCAII